MTDHPDDLTALIAALRGYSRATCPKWHPDGTGACLGCGATERQHDERAAADALSRLAAERDARPGVKFTVRTISNPRPIETTAPCLYTQVRPCKEEYPDDPDHWCGFCSRTHEAERVVRVIANRRRQPTKEK